jgi:hypothetical protein
LSVENATRQPVYLPMPVSSGAKLMPYRRIFTVKKGCSARGMCAISYIFDSMNAPGVRMGTPRHGCSTSKSASLLTKASAEQAKSSGGNEHLTL